MKKKVKTKWRRDKMPSRPDEDFLVTWRLETKGGVKYVVAASKYSGSSKDFVCPIDRGSFFAAWPVAWSEMPEPYIPEEP